MYATCGLQEKEDLALRHELVLAAHGEPYIGGHLSTHKTYEELRERYYWRCLFS